jgi:hypothetical protein
MKKIDKIFELDYIFYEELYNRWDFTALSLKPLLWWHIPDESLHHNHGWDLNFIKLRTEFTNSIRLK